MTDDDNVDADLDFTPAVADDAAPRSKSVRAPKRRGTFRRRATSFAVLIGALVTVGGTYAMLAPSSGAADSAISAQDVSRGKQIFETSCITCHGRNLEGVTGRGPSLIGVGSAATYFQVSTGRMPAVSQGAVNQRKPAKFGEDDTRRLAAYVQSMGGGPEVPTGNLRAADSTLSSGGELFRLNCASCHGATAAGAPLSAGKSAPGLKDATDAQIYTAMLSGPENMPVFSNNQITADQKREIVNYIQNLKASKDPGGAGLDRIGPVSEGLLVWTVALGALIVAILWIGAKS
ncbi:MAG TPA: cytochrome c [Jatrophihabitans sp.]|jgi:ubiquinol-cytochrome c reductase cytochrome c subunit